MDKIIFDIETQKGFKDVGGKNNVHLLKISILSFFSFKDNNFFALEEKEISQFTERLKANPILIGFNIKNFDLQVLKPYINMDINQLQCIDIMDDVVNYLGYRVSLDNLAFSTLNKKKSAQGLQALEWFKKGEIEKIKNYCLMDVKLTKEIYEFGAKYGFIKAFAPNNCDIIKIPVSFKDNLLSTSNIHSLQEAFQKKNRLKIKYLSGDVPDLYSEFIIEIYNLKGSFIEALEIKSNTMKLLKLDRIVEKNILNEKYQIPEDFKTKL